MPLGLPPMVNSCVILVAGSRGRKRQGLPRFMGALSAIHERKLHRATHGTFEEYCREKWGMSASRAYRLMDASEIMSPIGDKSSITTESQARELSRVEPARRDEVTRSSRATCPARRLQTSRCSS